ncbi:MAG: NADH-quinone oxidoreductase subunit J [Gammaproteobacteria bacterium]
MELTFYTCALVSVAAALRSVTHTNPVHALLYLVVMLLAVAGIFFALGAPFAGALEVIVYAGAIMVLFVFVVMMLNLGSETIAQEREWLKPRAWIGPCLLSALLLAALVEGILGTRGAAGTGTVDAKAVGIALFGPYLLAVELASMLLLGALIAAYHLGRDDTR